MSEIVPHDFGRIRLSYALPKMTLQRSRRLWRVVDTLLDLALILACWEAGALVDQAQLVLVDPAFESAQPPPSG